MVDGSDCSSSRAGMTTEKSVSGAAGGMNLTADYADNADENSQIIRDIRVIRGQEFGVHNGAETSSHSGWARACSAISVRMAAVGMAGRQFHRRDAFAESRTIHGMSNGRGV